jgi:hypothetical protein
MRVSVISWSLRPRHAQTKSFFLVFSVGDKNEELKYCE